VAARLRPEGIAVVHDAGRREDGLPFIVSQYVEGCSLKEWATRQRLAPAHAAELLAQVAQTAHSAHCQGFVHRDLKPGNILLDAHHKPHLVDFGLAVHEAQQRQRAGESAGTPHYMAPEQVRGETQWVDGRTDIWALGVTLYELLTGRLPFQGDTQKQLAQEILERDPKPPRQIDPTAPERLEAICLRRLAKRPADRYATAKDLAKDLRHWDAPPRRKAWLAGAALVVVLLSVLVAWRARGWLKPLPSGKTPQAVAGPATGKIDVFIWEPANPARRGLNVRTTGALPLKANDQLRIAAEVNRPMYLYVLWIGSEGKVWPVYPWQNGQWDSRPADDAPRVRLDLPEKLDEGWELAGPPGMETFVLLARDTALPRNSELEQWLQGLAAESQPFQSPLALVEFDSGEAISGSRDQDRGPKSFDPGRLDDPARQRQQLLVKKLGPDFSVIRAISVANQGE
jgi:hypothetical protein